MSDTLTMLGKLAPPEAQRDAVHVAVVPVVAGERLNRGQAVHCRDGQTAYAALHLGTAVGIVDPFIEGSVEPASRFWLFLKPGTITSLRHVWTHPDFAEEGEGPAVEAAVIQKAVSKAWMLAWCNERMYRGEEDMNRFLAALPSGEYCFNDDNHPYKWDDFPSEFWTHYKVLTGRERPTVEANFRCAC